MKPTPPALLPQPREIELKLQVPPARAAAVRKAMAGGEPLRLQARYYDTPDRRLAAAGIALRVRKEDGTWVQALKTRGDGAMQRGEHEAVRGRARAAPAPDAALHAGTPAGAALARALEGAAGGLEEVFATDIRRTRRHVRHAGSRVELAFDEGELRAGGARVQVCELELELEQGEPAALAALAARWVARQGLWLDPRSKAERGERLARTPGPAPAVHATPVALGAGMSGGQAWRAIVSSAIGQVLANASEIAADEGAPGHLHQCRVGLRRLRCALRDFAPVAPADAPPELAAWETQLRDALRRLGAARDRDALGAALLPQLAAAGAPLAQLPPAQGVHEDPAAVLREPAVNSLWLALLGWVQTPAAAEPGAPPLRRRVRARLDKLHARVAEDAAHFGELDDEAQHRARRRLKRLRYACESCSSLFEAHAVAPYLDALRAAQDALGAAQDLVAARELFEPHVNAEPRAWFVLGWLAARRPAAVAQSAAAMARVAAAPRFWERKRR